MRTAAERALESSRELRPPTSTEVGRYDIVVGAGALAGLFTRTLAEAVNAERALGYRANLQGTSFAAPPESALGSLKLGSPLLTVRGERSEKHAAATVAYDDEGVAPREFTFIENGVLTDYFASRETAAELAGWYGKQGLPLHSNGCASGSGAERPTVQLPNLTIVPGAENLSAQDLIADTARGFYIESVSGGADQQLLSAQLSGGGVREIRNGKLGGWVKDFAIQFLTPTFWQSMDAIGGATGEADTLVGTDYIFVGDAIQLPYATVRAVPARFREVNVLNTGRVV